MKKATRILALLLALVLSLALFAGCGDSTTDKKDSTSKDSKTDSGSADSLTEVTWVSPAALASLDFCWIYVADDMGYFEDEGLKVNIIESTDGSDAKFLASGSADFCASSPAVALSTVDAGATNITAVMNNVCNNIFGIAYNEQSGIKDWSDLEGKTIAITSEAMTSIYSPIFEAAGVDPDSVEYVVYSSARYEALNTGAADAMGTWTSEFYMCEGMGYDTWGYLSGNDVLPQIANSLWVNNDFAEENPEIVKGFVRAILKAMYFCYKNPEAAADITLNRFPEIECTWEGAVGAVTGNVYGMLGATEEEQAARIEAHEIGTYDMDIVAQTITNLKNGGSIKQDLDPATYYTNDYVDTTWDYSTIDTDAEAYECTSSAYAAANS